MKCKQVDKRIEAYLDGELRPRVRGEVDRHLELCAKCREQVEKARQTVSALRESTRAALPEDFSRQVMSRLPEAIPSARLPFSFPALPQRKLRPLVAGVVLLTLVIGGYFWLKGRGGELPTLRRELQVAWQALSEGNLGKATISYRRAVDSNPKSVEARLGLAYVLWEGGSFEESLKQYEKVIALASADAGSSAIAYESLGKIYQDEGQLEKAAECYQWAVRLSPKLVDSHTNLALIYEEWGWDSEAARECETVAKIAPTNSFAYEALGRIREHSGELHDGAEAYQRSIEVSASPVAYWRLGRLYDEMGWLEGSTIAYQMAVFPTTEPET